MIGYRVRMRAYSIDLRQRILRAVDEGCTAEEAAALYDVHVATVRRYVRLRRLEGTIVPKKSTGRPRHIRASEETALRAQVAAHPDALLAEYCEHWVAQTQQVVSIATMSRALARLQLTRKTRPSMPKSRMQTCVRPGVQR